MASKRPPFIPIARKAFLPVEKGGDLFWNESRVFSRWEAWQFLIVHAARKPVRRVIPRPGKLPVVIELNRGEVYGSNRWFGRRWQWSEKKVRTFFLYLENKCGKIRTQQQTQVGSVYLLVKYGEFNGDVAPMDAPDAAAETHQGLTKDSPETQGSRRDVRRDKEGKEKNDVVGDSAVQTDLEKFVSGVIRTANKGMIESGVDFEPILVQHASRQCVFDWLEAGIPREIIEHTVFTVAKAAGKKISSMKYFDNAVRASHEKAQSNRVEIPEGSQSAEVRKKGVAANYPQSNGQRVGHLAHPITNENPIEDEKKRVEAFKKSNPSDAERIWNEIAKEAEEKNLAALGKKMVNGFMESRFRRRVIDELLTPRLAVS